MINYEEIAKIATDTVSSIYGIDNPWSLTFTDGELDTDRCSFGDDIEHLVVNTSSNKIKERTYDILYMEHSRFMDGIGVEINDYTLFILDILETMSPFIYYEKFGKHFKSMTKYNSECDTLHTISRNRNSFIKNDKTTEDYYGINMTNPFISYLVKFSHDLFLRVYKNVCKFYNEELWKCDKINKIDEKISDITYLSLIDITMDVARQYSDFSTCTISVEITKPSQDKVIECFVTYDINGNKYEIELEKNASKVHQECFVNYKERYKIFLDDIGVEYNDYTLFILCYLHELGHVDYMQRFGTYMLEIHSYCSQLQNLFEISTTDEYNQLPLESVECLTTYANSIGDETYAERYAIDNFMHVYKNIVHATGNQNLWKL